MYFEWLIRVGYVRMALHYRNVNDSTVNGFVKMRKHGGFGDLHDICRLSYFLHRSTVYLIVIVLMNCTSAFVSLSLKF
jgi:hypothetical protein